MSIKKYIIMIRFLIGLSILVAMFGILTGYRDGFAIGFVVTILFGLAVGLFWIYAFFLLIRSLRRRLFPLSDEKRYKQIINNIGKLQNRNTYLTSQGIPVSKTEGHLKRPIEEKKEIELRLRLEGKI